MLSERNGGSNPARVVSGKDTHRSNYMFEYRSGKRVLVWNH